MSEIDNAGRIGRCCTVALKILVAGLIAAVSDVVRATTIEIGWERKARV